jgi:hypothetical protein
VNHHFKSFWFGESLTPYEVLCIQSFLDHGHTFCVYSYDRLELPKGAESRDAREILPREEVFFYQRGPGKGGVSAFSNRFRYALLLEEGGWWVDMDMVCLSANYPESQTFFAVEEQGRVNNALLRFPRGHAVMKDCAEFANATGKNIEFGATGPQLLSDTLAKHTLMEMASTSDTCYPVHWRDYLMPFDPAMRSAVENCTGNSIAFHLWNEMLRRIRLDKQKEPPKGSFLDSLFLQHGIKFMGGQYTYQEIIRLRDILRIKAGLKRRFKSMFGVPGS